jgi:hypothetical protein
VRDVIEWIRIAMHSGRFQMYKATGRVNHVAKDRDRLPLRTKITCIGEISSADLIRQDLEYLENVPF